VARSSTRMQGAILGGIVGLASLIPLVLLGIDGALGIPLVVSGVAAGLVVGWSLARPPLTAIVLFLALNIGIATALAATGLVGVRLVRGPPIEDLMMHALLLTPYLIGFAAFYLLPSLLMAAAWFPAMRFVGRKWNHGGGG